MTEHLDIVKFIEENPITKLTSIYQSRLINKIKNKFNTEEQKLFVLSFYCYLKYKKGDFVININSIWKWLGFSSKQKAKEILLKNFVIEIDYKISLNLQVERVHGGQNMEQITMTVRTFKKICMKANTKKSNDIHDYFINLQEILHETLNEETDELRIQLYNTEIQLEQKQLELDKEKKSKNWLLNRIYSEFKLGDVIYLYKEYKNDNIINEYSTDDTEQFIFKIGKTKNITDRETYYSNSSKSGKIVYIQYCLNCDLTEKILHHIFDKYRIVRNQEWFNFTEDIGIKSIKSIIHIMDHQMKEIQDFIPKLYGLLDIKDIVHEDKVIEIEDKIIEIVKNPNDFDLFISQCCVIIDGVNTPKTYIKDAHRIWSKCSNKQTIAYLDIYLKDKLKSTTIIDENGVKRNMFKDIKLNPLVYNISDKNLDYEQFITEQVSDGKMNINWKCRVSYVDFFNHFIEWKKNKNPNYKLICAYKRQIQEYLEDKFAGGRVYISTDAKALHLYGIWGLGHISSKFGYKEPARTNKIICKYSIDNKLIKKWNSLSIASRELNIKISTLSNNARFKTVIDNFYYKYE